ncbi:hypothetical protein TARUN_6264 [Trichoderma arundinaceum]|uniref:Uncharacterized protein n=1 Tax=Trichoderma arundinaceum TaxID=490622 RepID=A0A395NIW5_TRIAR|nr:hypothetical protein TARUN_6264 [Trichoderma arundinaceum]
MTVQIERPMLPPNTRAWAMAPCAVAFSLDSAVEILVIIVVAEKQRPTPSPNIAWYAYWDGSALFAPVWVVISPSPKSWRQEDPMRVYEVLFCLLDIAPPKNDPTAQAPRSGKRWIPAMRASSPLTIWKRSGITINYLPADKCSPTQPRYDEGRYNFWAGPSKYLRAGLLNGKHQQGRTAKQSKASNNIYAGKSLPRQKMRDFLQRPKTRNGDLAQDKCIKLLLNSLEVEEPSPIRESGNQTSEQGPKDEGNSKCRSDQRPN